MPIPGLLELLPVVIVLAIVVVLLRVMGRTKKPPGPSDGAPAADEERTGWR